ncbi:MAG TPA: ROK family protein [Blastocatellia bacterium]|nr:ROK family protein [Blastocatellia bacterium]
MRPNILGIDLGGTKVQAAVFDSDACIIGRARAKTRAWRDEDEVFATITQVGHRAIEDAGVALSSLAAAAIGAPGPIDTNTGYIIESVNLGFTNFPLGPRLCAEFNCQTLVENDVNAGVYGEFKAGAARGASDVVGIFVGTGIGGGLILNRSLHRGFTRNAGEIGHMVVKAGGPRCNCGNRGCLEAVASRTAITRDIRKAIKRRRHSLASKLLQKNAELLSGKELKSLYDAGDQLVIDTVKRAARLIGVGIGSLMNVLAPEVIVLGGGVVEAFGADFIERIDRTARSISFEINSKDVKITRAELGDDAGVIGAAMLAREALKRTSD